MLTCATTRKEKVRYRFPCGYFFRRGQIKAIEQEVTFLLPIFKLWTLEILPRVNCFAIQTKPNDVKSAAQIPFELNAIIICSQLLSFFWSYIWNSNVWVILVPLLFCLRKQEVLGGRHLAPCTFSLWFRLTPLDADSGVRRGALVSAHEFLSVVFTHPLM